VNLEEVAPMGVEDFDHLYLESQQFDEHLRFWHVLGFDIAQEWGEEGHRACRLQAGQAKVVLAEGTATPSVHFSTREIEEYAKELERKRVPIEVNLEETHWGTRWMVVRDPDGNTFALEEGGNGAEETTERDSGIEAIDHLHLQTLSFDEAIRFWEFLGFRLLDGWMQSGSNYRGARLHAGEAYLAIVEWKTPIVEVHFRTPDLEPLAQAVMASDAVRIHLPLETAHWGSQWMVVEDPDGRLHALEQPIEGIERPTPG
jgi:uncharacterized glyoxalase superfamily protein PhnB